MNQESGDEIKSGFENGNFFVVYSPDACALRDFEKRCGGAMKIVGNAFLWFVGLPFEKFPEHSLEEHFFNCLKRGCLYNKKKSSAGSKGGNVSGKVKQHRVECRDMSFNGDEDIRGALTSGDCEIAIQAVMQYCGMRGDRKFENALRKRAKVIGTSAFSELCDRVITTEQEPAKRSAAIIGKLDDRVKEIGADMPCSEQHDSRGH